VAHYPTSRLVKSIYQKLAAVLLPSHCFLCGASAGSRCLCEGCAADLPALPVDACPNCQLPTIDGMACGACLKSPPAFDSLASAFSYEFPADRLILALKYRAHFGLAAWLAESIAPRLNDAAKCADAIVPLPLHPARMAGRGFNHSMEIGRRLASLTGIPLMPQALAKIRATPSQAGLPAKTRKANLKGAFAAAPAVQGLRLLLLDDVLTTGATLGEAARCLKAAGASRVDAATAMRTLPRRQAGLP
jgi:ComF family protein